MEIERFAIRGGHGLHTVEAVLQVVLWGAGNHAAGEDTGVPIAVNNNMRYAQNMETCVRMTAVPPLMSGRPRISEGESVRTERGGLTYDETGTGFRNFAGFHL